MKLPRNVDGDELARLLNRYGYRIDHQTGSHQRLSADISGKTHDLTIPRHKPLRVGTLHEILKDVAEHQKMSREQIIMDLFGQLLSAIAVIALHASFGWWKKRL